MRHDGKVWNNIFAQSKRSTVASDASKTRDLTTRRSRPLRRYPVVASGRSIVSLSETRRRTHTRIRSLLVFLMLNVECHHDSFCGTRVYTKNLCKRVWGFAAALSTGVLWNNNFEALTVLCRERYKHIFSKPYFTNRVIDRKSLASSSFDRDNCKSQNKYLDSTHTILCVNGCVGQSGLRIVTKLA